MKKLAAIAKRLSLGSIALLTILAPIPTLASPVGYLGKDGYYFINNLAKGKVYYVNFSGMSLTRTAVSNKCGILEFKPSKNEANKVDKIEVKDEPTQKTYGFSFKGLPSKEVTTCNGQVNTNHEAWVTKTGYIAISGLTPDSSQTIKFLSNAPIHNLKANECGFLRFKLDPTATPTAFIVDGLAYPTNGQPGQGIYCKKGTLYVQYPPPTPINPVDANTWLQQNPQPILTFSSGTQILASSSATTSSSTTANSTSSTGTAQSAIATSKTTSGGSTSSGGTTSSSGSSGSGTSGSAGSGTSSGGSSSSGGTTSSGSSSSGGGSGGTTSSGSSSGGSGGSGGTTSSSSSSSSGGSSSGGSTSSGGGSTVASSGGSSSGGGSSGTSSSPKPPSGQVMCKVGSSQLLVTGLATGKKYYAATEEDNTYSEANPSSDGYALFSNIGYNDKWEGQSADLEVGYIDPKKADYENRVPLGGQYLKKLNTIPVCQ